MRGISVTAIEQYRKNARNDADIPVEVLKVKINCLIDASKHIKKGISKTIYQFGQCKMAVDENNIIISITWDRSAPGPNFIEIKELYKLNRKRGLNKRGTRFLSEREKNFDPDKELECLESILLSGRIDNKQTLKKYFDNVPAAIRLEMIDKLLDGKAEEHRGKIMEALCQSLPSNILLAFILSRTGSGKEEIKTYVDIDGWIHSTYESGSKKIAAALIDWSQSLDTWFEKHSFDESLSFVKAAGSQYVIKFLNYISAERDWDDVCGFLLQEETQQWFSPKMAFQFCWKKIICDECPFEKVKILLEQYLKNNKDRRIKIKWDDLQLLADKKISGNVFGSVRQYIDMVSANLLEANKHIRFSESAGHNEDFLQKLIDNVPDYGVLYIYLNTRIKRGYSFDCLYQLLIRAGHEQHTILDRINSYPLLGKIYFSKNKSGFYMQSLNVHLDNSMEIREQLDQYGLADLINRIVKYRIVEYNMLSKRFICSVEVENEGI